MSYACGVTESDGEPDGNGLELMTAADVADRLGVSVETVNRWRYDGDLPYVRLGYRTVRYLESDVARLVWMRRRVM